MREPTPRPIVDTDIADHRSETPSWRDQVVPSPPAAGFDRLRARFRRRAFAPHAHETYAIGITRGGVQRFRYRGARRHSLPGQAFVLHPDETHDGQPGDARGYAYEIVYIDPALIAAACQGAPLPFIDQPVIADRGGRETGLTAAIRACLTDPDMPLSTLDVTCRITALADAMTAAVGAVTIAGPVYDRAVRRAHAVLMDTPDRRIAAAELEDACGIDRWTLARHFRARYGISPSRFHIRRRLRHAAMAIRAGADLADAAQLGGFADQSHFTRHFVRAHGLTPGVWRDIAAPPAGAMLSMSRT